MPAIQFPEERKSRGELQSWYLGSLRPRLTHAVGSGLVTASAAAAFDQQLRDFLDLPVDAR
jgi:hypothetical protein